MTESRHDHPPIEELAAFAEGRARDPSAIEAHVDRCEACALEVLAAREAIAFEALSDDRPSMTREFAARASRQLSAVLGGKAPAAGGFDALGTAGLLGGLGALGFLAPGPDMVLADSDHPDEGGSHSEKNPDAGEIPRGDAPSHPAEDEISRMLDHLRDVLGDEAIDHPAEDSGRTPPDDDAAGHADPLIEPDDAAADPGGIHDHDATDVTDDDHSDHPWGHDDHSHE